METWQSWALFLAIVGAGYWYYSQKQGAASRGRSTTQRTTTASSVKQSAQWVDTEVKKAAKAVKAKAPRKSVKTAVQEAGNKAAASLSAASSTAGVDADDDLSPVASPSITTKAPSGRDVSDMLGSQAAAPSVLSIKSSEKPARPAKPQALKAEAPQESKKARQNRRKVEEAKAAREAEEKQRQALLEKQRRTAREARGEPAKNGVQAAKAPTLNAWTTVRSAGAVQPPASAPTGQLLDTFDAASTASSSEAPTNGTVPTPDSLSNSGRTNNALSEEEQVKLALEDTTAWETVPKGGKKQKKKAVGNDSPEEDRDFGIPQVPQPVKPVHIDKYVRPTLSENKKPSSRYQILQEEFTAGADNADDWPVV